MYGGTFNPSLSAWLYPAFAPFKQHVLSDLEKLNVPVPATALTRIAEVEKGYTELAGDLSYYVYPYKHQEDSLAFLLAHPRAALYLDCGLGKTKILLDMIRAVKAPALVLCPKMVIQTWLDEAAKHAKELKILAVTGTPKKRRRLALEAADIRVISYDSVNNYLPQLLRTKYEIIIADESHNLRSHDSSRTAGALALSRKATRRVVSTGTPLLGDPRHIWAQLKFLGEFIVDTYWKFTKRYVSVLPSNKHIAVGYKNLHLLKETVDELSVRHKKEDCLDLPERVINDFRFRPSPEQVGAYYEILKTGKVADLKGVPQTVSAATLLNKLLQVISGFYHPVLDTTVCDDCEHKGYCIAKEIDPYTPRCLEGLLKPPPVRIETNNKVEALLQLVESMHDRVIVWAKYRESLDLCDKALSEHYKVARVDGQVHRIPDDWQVYLSQVSMGTGINELATVPYAVYYDLDWDLASYLQSLDRNYRIGTNKRVFVYRLLSTFGADNLVARCLDAKLDVLKIIMERMDCLKCEQASGDCSPFNKKCVYQKSVGRPVATP